MYIMNVVHPTDPSATISIPFEDESRIEIIQESVKRIISYVNGEISLEELDEDTLAPEVLAVSGPAH